MDALEKGNGMDGSTEIETTAPESKRARVRRLLIEPLTSQGMRFKHGTAVEVQRKRLDRMADDLGYMHDDALVVLRRCLLRNGEGVKKCFWPERVSYLGYAHAFQPRSIDDEPAMLAWFASVAGREAQAVPGLAVAQYEFWCKYWHPPFAEKHKRAVMGKVAENAQRLAYCEARDAEGSLRDPDHIAWLKAYREKAAKVAGWIKGASA
jgi:hypothetical protein